MVQVRMRPYPPRPRKYCLRPFLWHRACAGYSTPSDAAECRPCGRLHKACAPTRISPQTEDRGPIADSRQIPGPVQPPFCKVRSGALRTLCWETHGTGKSVISIIMPLVKVMKLSTLFFLLPLMANAQVNRCESQDGQITFTEALCPASEDERPALQPQVRVARPPSPFMLAMAKAAAQSAPDRLETIRVMLVAGKLSQARQFARTEQERALVREMDRGHVPDRKKRSFVAR